jgi:hypothetical protein
VMGVGLALVRADARKKNLPPCLRPLTRLPAYGRRICMIPGVRPPAQPTKIILTCP